MYHETHDLWKALLQTGLKDDGMPWDWTSLGISNDREVKAQILAKSQGVWAAGLLVRALCSLAPTFQVSQKVIDGGSFQPGDVILEITGNAQEILALERPFINIAAYVSGIATQTHRLVEQVKKTCPKSPPRVTLTRKTLPGYRDIAIQGVRMGGGFPHRVSLSGGVLIKENHIAAAGGISKAVAAVQKVAPHGLKIEVEVRSIEELQQAIQAKAEGVLLDNFTPKKVAQALQFLTAEKSQLFVEVSGGLNETNIADYAIPGVHVLSVGGLTHSVQSVDLSLLIQ